MISEHYKNHSRNSSFIARTKKWSLFNIYISGFLFGKDFCFLWLLLVMLFLTRFYSYWNAKVRKTLREESQCDLFQFLFCQSYTWYLVFAILLFFCELSVFIFSIPTVRIWVPNIIILNRNRYHKLIPSFPDSNFSYNCYTIFLKAEQLRKILI